MNTTTTTTSTHVSRLIVAFFVLLSLTLIFSACGTPTPTEGTVVDKASEPGEWETKTKQTCTGKGTKRKCKSKQVQEWDDPDFEIQIRSCDKDDKCSEHWIEVSESEYNSLNEGDHWEKS